MLLSSLCDVHFEFETVFLVTNNFYCLVASPLTQKPTVVTRHLYEAANRPQIWHNGNYPYFSFTLCATQRIQRNLKWWSELSVLKQRKLTV